jgi:isopenicillin N synthase-like dioxygenase
MSHFAAIPTLSLSALARNDEVECLKLFDVCKKLGFFYLDYISSERLPTACINDLFDFAHKFYALPEHEKMKISMESSGTYFGFAFLLS